MEGMITTPFAAPSGARYAASFAAHGMRPIRMFGPSNAGGGQGLGAMPDPMFDAEGCRCHDVVEDGRERILGLVSSTTLVTDEVRRMLASCRGIEWEGNAASFFRKRIVALAAAMDACDEAAAATASIV